MEAQAACDPVLRAGPLVFVDDLANPVVSDGDWHHLTRVLRHRAGSMVCLGDGAGRWRTGQLAPVPTGLGPVHDLGARKRPVTVGLAMPKGSRLDMAVQKLTELGVDAVVLLHADRSVVRWSSAEVQRKLARLQKVVMEAAMQARQLWLPTLVGPVTPAEFIGQFDGGGASVAFAEPGGVSVSLDVPAVLVGPEGGWTPDELGLGATTVALGQSVLRVETAAITAGVLLTALRDNPGPQRTL